MGSGSLAPPVPASSAPVLAGSWRLAPAIAAEAQGLLASPFGALPEALALFLALPAGAGGGWLGKLVAQVPITDATGQTAPSAAIGFTSGGLVAMGLDPAANAGFSLQFLEGMHQIDRQRRLGDDVASTVIDGGPIWSGNAPDAFAADAAGRAVPTPVTVHALLLLYEADDAKLQIVASTARSVLAAAGVGIVREVRLSLHADPTIADTPREHFGFADGMSQPIPFGDAIVSDAGAPYPRDPLHGIAAGDLLIGQPNAHDEPSPGPLLPKGSDPENLLPDALAHGLRDLGRNGSYLVVRELRQDVPAFWTSMDQAAAALGQPGIDADWIAARIIGRDRNGTPLVPAAALPAPGHGDPRNDFAYAPHDMQGMTCPMGAHMRRANPRDGLAPAAADAADLLKAANNHRILRRGRKFGEPIADPRVPDGKDRGLLFMCLNTDIARQFEFVQQTWMLSPGFAVLDHDETDPLMGPPGGMTIPALPLRWRPQVQTYIRFVGGDYFFLPSLPALRYLASL